jgi:hypothetical protein
MVGDKPHGKRYLMAGRPVRFFFCMCAHGAEEDAERTACGLGDPHAVRCGGLGGAVAWLVTSGVITDVKTAGRVDKNTQTRHMTVHCIVEQGVV